MVQESQLYELVVRLVRCARANDLPDYSRVNRLFNITHTKYRSERGPIRSSLEMTADRFDMARNKVSDYFTRLINDLPLKPELLETALELSSPYAKTA